MEFRLPFPPVSGSRLVLPLAALMQLVVAFSGNLQASTTVSSGGFNNPPLSLFPGSDAYRPQRQGTYLYEGPWYTDAWPKPVTGVVEVPRSRFACVEVETPESIRSIRAGRGEFYLLDETGRFHTAPAQYPGRLSPINAPAQLDHETDFLVAGGVIFPSAEGLIGADPGPRLLTPFVTEPAITPAQPLIFLNQTALRPGITYKYYGEAYTAVPNSGLLLPRTPGEPEGTPRRAHTLHKVLNTYGTLSVALGTLHPDTPGYALGTQVLFRSNDFGVTWTFTPLPAEGKWRDLTITDLTGFRGITPFHNQIVIVGDAGIYTSMGPNGPWKHIVSNTTAANPGDVTLSFPIPSPDDPLAETVPLRLRSVTWAQDRFVAAGVTNDASATPIVVEGAGIFWFAYPIEGWPADRSIDEIAAFDDRRLFLSRATGEKPSLLVANRPVYAPQGVPPSIGGPAFSTPELGTQPAIRFYPNGPITRYIVENTDNDQPHNWFISGEYLLHRTTVWLSKPGSGTIGYRYLTDSTPVRLRITPINEFGRGTPFETEIRPQPPGFIVPGPSGAPRLSAAKHLRTALGSAVHLPIQDLNPKVNWWRHYTWFYELPEGLYFDDYQQAIRGHVLESGVHEIRILAINEGGVSWTGPLTLTVPEPEPKPADAGNFSGLLDGTDALSGLWRVSLRTNRTFTGNVKLLGSSHSFRGRLTPVPQQPGLFAAELLIERGKRQPLQLKLTLDVQTGGLALHARVGEEEAATVSAAVLHSPWASDRQSARSGHYTARIATSEDGSDSPAGNGFLRLVIAKNGVVTIRGELANGLRLTAASTLSASDALPVFWKPDATRSLRGVLAFDADNRDDDRFAGALAWRTSRDEKCPAYGPAADLSVNGHRVAVLASGEHPAHVGGYNRVVLTHPELARFGYSDGRAEAVFQGGDYPKFWPVQSRGDTGDLAASLSLDPDTGLASGAIFLNEPGRKKVKVTLRAISVYSDEEHEGRLFGHFLFRSSDGKKLLSGHLVSEPTDY